MFRGVDRRIFSPHSCWKPKNPPKSQNTKKTPRLRELFRQVHVNFRLLPCDTSQEPNGNCSEKLVQMHFFILGGFFLLISVVRKSAQKIAPGKSPAKSSKIHTAIILNTFLQRGWGGTRKQEASNCKQETASMFSENVNLVNTRQGAFRRLLKRKERFPASEGKSRTAHPLLPAERRAN